MRMPSVNRMLVPIILTVSPLVLAADRQQLDDRQPESADRIAQHLDSYPPSAAGPRGSKPAVRNIAPQQRPLLFNYRPPNRGAPSQRVGGGTRSIDQLSVLAPRHIALTTQAQPRLYWFTTPGFRNNVRFRLGEAGIQPPLLEIQLPPQPDGGVHHLDLAVHDVHLEPGKLYEWGVILEPFPHQRIPPLVSRGRIAMDETDHPTLQDAPIEQRPYVAARQGYWYDAVDWISRLIADTGDAGLYRQRADLLEQGDLFSASLYERETRGR